MSTSVQPVFLISTGRAGSTALFKVMTHHPEMAYLTGFAEPGLFKLPFRRFRRSRALPRLYFNRFVLNLSDLPFVGSTVRTIAKPVEVYPFWHQLFGGMTATYRDLQGGDVSDKARKRISSTLQELPVGKKTIPLIKLTGWPRAGFFGEIFPDAKFIHLIRDGRAVANSFINVDFWNGWKGPRQWRYGPLPLRYQEEWDYWDQSFVALAAIQWKILIDAFEKARDFISADKWCTVKYEEFCSAPVHVLQETFEYLGVKWSQKLEKAVLKSNCNNHNDKWKDDLANHQQKILEAVLHTHLSKYGYL